MMRSAARAAAMADHSDTRSEDMVIASQTVPSQYEEDKEDGRGEGSDFVVQCRAHARQLRERKEAQQQRMEALVEDSFGQIEQIFHSLLQVAQAGSAATQAQFDDTSAQLEENLTRHQQVEAKLRGIMAILLGSQGEM